MSIIDILLNGNIIFATIVFVLIAITTEIIGRKVLILLQEVTFSEYLFEKIFIPLARAIGLMVFILLCYPVLFGLNEAPPLSQLLSAGSHRTSTLMNVLFIVPLLFSLIPVLGSLPALILPVQGIAGASLVFSWMQGALNIQDIQYLPSFVTVLFIILFAIITHAVARWLSFHLSENINRSFNIDDGQKIAYRIVIVAAQLPVIFIYTRGLGVQL
jgi:hypothetical protein